MNTTNNITFPKLSLQIENLDTSVLEYFNEKNPISIETSEGEKKQIRVFLNIGETWEQVIELEKKQVRGDYIPKRPLITLKTNGLIPIKEWNRNSALRILLDKQLYKNPNISTIDIGKPVFEYTYMTYPTHFLRTYRLNVWTDFIEDQNRIIESVITKLMSSNSIMIESKNYKTIGYLRDMTDDSNFDDRSNDYRQIKNYIDLEFEGYLIDPNSIVKKRSASTIKITEEIVKEII